MTLPRLSVDRSGPTPEVPHSSGQWGYNPPAGQPAGLGRTGTGRAARRHGRPLHLGPRRVGLGQQLLLGRGAGRHQELEGVLLRLVGRGQLHHHRQATGRPVGHGAVGAARSGSTRWSILVPQALEGVAAVGLLYAGVRRWFGAGAGLLAGAVLALTPVAALMFRFNNPDALLVLTLTAAAYAMVRALEAGRTRWLVAAGTLVGFGFVTKMLQALLVVPAFALVYLFAGPPKLGRRIVQLLIAAAAMAVSSLWWVVAVMAVPASQRPYIGGSQNNSLWNLIFGYNGFGRLTGSESGSVGGGGGGNGRALGPDGVAANVQHRVRRPDLVACCRPP